MPPLTGTHGGADYLRAVYQQVCRFLMNESPPQLTSIACRYRILSEAMKNYLISMILKSPEQSRMHCIPFFNTNQYQQNQ